MIENRVPEMIAHDMPLRPDMIVRIVLPFNLTMDDANRVAAFVRSLAFASEQTSDAAIHESQLKHKRETGLP